MDPMKLVQVQFDVLVPLMGYALHQRSEFLKVRPQRVTPFSCLTCKENRCDMEAVFSPSPMSKSSTNLSPNPSCNARAKPKS